MNKIEMAHDYAKELLGGGKNLTPDNADLYIEFIPKFCFGLAEAMLAEDEKRKDKGLPEALQDEFVIDWDGVSDRYDYWVMDKDGRCFWYEREPRRDSTEFYQNCDICLAPDFGYKGDWKQSLRKRPE